MSARATEFRIWQIASGVDWQCTAAEIAEEMGVHVNTVKNALKRRGWTGRLPNNNRSYTGRAPVDWAMRHSSPNWTGRV